MARPYSEIAASRKRLAEARSADEVRAIIAGDPCPEKDMLFDVSVYVPAPAFDAGLVDQVLDAGHMDRLTIRGLAYERHTAPLVQDWVRRAMADPAHPARGTVWYALRGLRAARPSVDAIVAFAVERIGADTDGWRTETGTLFDFLATLSLTEDHLLTLLSALAPETHEWTERYCKAIASHPGTGGRVASALWKADVERVQFEDQRYASRNRHMSSSSRQFSGSLSTVRRALINNPAVWTSATSHLVREDATLKRAWTYNVDPSLAPAVWLDIYTAATQEEQTFMLGSIKPGDSATILAAGFAPAWLRQFGEHATMNRIWALTGMLDAMPEWLAGPILEAGLPKLWLDVYRGTVMVDPSAASRLLRALPTTFERPVREAGLNATDLAPVLAEGDAETRVRAIALTRPVRQRKRT